MLAILNSINDHNSPILKPILMILVSKFMVHRALSNKTYLSLGLLSPFISMHAGKLCMFFCCCLLFIFHYLSFKNVKRVSNSLESRSDLICVQTVCK